MVTTTKTVPTKQPGKIPAKGAPPMKGKPPVKGKPFPPKPKGGK